MTSNLNLHARTDFSRCPYYTLGNCHANDGKPCYREKNSLGYENCHLRNVNLGALETIAKSLAS